MKSRSLDMRPGLARSAGPGPRVPAISPEHLTSCAVLGGSRSCLDVPWGRLSTRSHARRLTWKGTDPRLWTECYADPSDGAQARAGAGGRANSPMNDVTRILSAMAQGDPQASDQ